MKKYFIVLLTILILTGCTFSFVNDEEFYGTNIDSTSLVNDIIREKAYFAAETYLASDMEYKEGGDDVIYVPPYTTRGIDCSGLIINVYKYAVEGSNYSLPFTDKTADEMYKYYSDDIDSPQKGDLIIWTYNNDHAYHIALFEKTEDGYYYFIESNIPTEYTVDGVGYRRMSVNTPLNISLKRLKLKDNI